LRKPLGKPLRKPSSTNIKKDEIPIYTYCGYGKYKKCFYLYPKLRPKDWKLFKGKDYLMRENLNKKSNKASIQNHAESGNSSKAS